MNEIKLWLMIKEEHGNTFTAVHMFDFIKEHFDIEPDKPEPSDEEVLLEFMGYKIWDTGISHRYRWKIKNSDNSCCYESRQACVDSVLDEGWNFLAEVDKKLYNTTRDNHIGLIPEGWVSKSWISRGFKFYGNDIIIAITKMADFIRKLDKQ